MRGLRARGARFYAPLRPRASRKLPNDLRAENVARLAGALARGVHNAGGEAGERSGGASDQVAPLAPIASGVLPPLACFAG
jgi:hypothetical protein